MPKDITTAEDMEKGRPVEDFSTSQASENERLNVRIINVNGKNTERLESIDGCDNLALNGGSTGEDKTSPHEDVANKDEAVTITTMENQNGGSDCDSENEKIDTAKAEDCASIGDAGDLTVPSGDTVDGLDEVDRASMFSYYMKHDFRFFFQHPYSRLLIAYLVTFCNFLIYAEDPVAHSEKECFIPVVGNCFAFVCTRYPPNAWALLKVFLWLAAIVIGIVVGKLVIHELLFNRLFKLKMFFDDQGSWMTMFFTSIFCLFVFSWIYNGFLAIGGDSTLDYRISDMMGIRNSWFMKAAACGTWCGDFFTAWMVTDIMLQEQLYPKWAVRVRPWWVRDYHRIILFWVIVVVTSAAVITVISTDWIQWDKLNHDFVHSNELARGILASFILVMDLVILMQDWDFPHFINNFDIKLPGLNTAHFSFDIPKFLRPEKWTIHISGKWFNYGIILFVLMLDLNMWKNQIFYFPADYGQYTDGIGRIYSVKDTYSLENLANETYLNYTWRATNINPETNMTYMEGDVTMNSRYKGISLGVKSVAFLPSLIAALCFGILIWYFGRWKPSEKDHYAGRLMRRRKFKRMLSRLSKRASARRSDPEVVLQNFKNKAEPGDDTI